MRSSTRRWCATWFLCCSLLACGSDDDEGVPAVDLATLGVDAATQERCDPLADPCLLPLPNDHYTVADEATATGRRLALDPASIPTNRRGVAADVSDQNRGDGWSPGSSILVALDGLDVEASGLAGLDDAAPSLDDDAPIVLIDTTTGERHPYWAEIDVLGDPGGVPMLFVRPAKNFSNGHRIVVGMRRLRDAAGNELPTSPAFAAYRDGLPTTDPVFESRRPNMEQVFADLRRAGVRRGDLQLAWDFTIASADSIAGRMLAIRDDAFAALAGNAPSFRVDQVTDHPNAFVRRRVEGSFAMPLYLTRDGQPRSRLVLDDAGVPQRQPGTFTATFTCNLPPASVDAPARMSLYGHGLLGDQDEVNGDLTRKMSRDYNIAYCATNWYGMAGEDVSAAVAALGDLSFFPSIPDRSLQGFLAFLYLGRLMKHPQGFSSHDAFRFDGRSALKTDELYYDGNSQGAILGGSLAAVGQDFTRVVLGEAGMNYSTLLDRSVDFDGYLAAVMKPAYPRRYDRIVGIFLAQLLWDRSETNGYANHITRDPLPGTPAKQVLLLGAVGDHQVSEFALRVQAATMGVPAHKPIAEPGRVAESDPGWLLDTITYPHRGSAYYSWDTGALASPVANTAPREGHDPHDDTPNIPEVRQTKHEFMQPNGALSDPCDGACTAPIPPERGGPPN